MKAGSLILAITISAAVALPALASPPPLRILQKVELAAGGAHWKGVTAVSAAGKESIDGLECRVHFISDIRDGRWRKTLDCPVFETAKGIDSRGAWRQDRSGQVHSLDSPEAVRLTVTDRWLNREGPYFPTRYHVIFTPAPETVLGRTTYQRIEATPPGGRSVMLWIGGQPRRIERMIMRRSFQTVTTRYSDYREVNGVVLPFRIVSSVAAHAKPDVETITRYHLWHSVPEHALDRPSDHVTDATIPSKGVRIPFNFSPSGKLLVETRINGKGPFPFVLDTGGHAILTPATAKALGLKTSGGGVSYGAGAGSSPVSYARIRSIGLGDARISNQPVLVMPMSPILTDRGDKPPVAGILGLEVFERFAVTVDPAHKWLTLQSFKAFKAPAKSIGLRIRFTDDMPLVHATLDGKRGIFGIDTGNSGPLMLFPTWAKRNGLSRYYSAGLAEQDGGIGGMFTAHMAYIHSLRLGNLTVPGKQLGLLTPHGVGATSNPSEAGNLGMSVWRAFTFSFDYRKERLYLTPRADFTPKLPTATGGFQAVKFAHNAFMVMGVTPKGPAARAGLKKGDQIVAVNSVNAAKLASLYLMEYVAKSKPGTRVKLTLGSGHTITLKLAPNTVMQKALQPKVREAR